MKFTSTLVTIVAVLRSADAKKDKEEVVEMVDVDTKSKLVVDYPTYFPTYAPTVSEDEVSSKCAHDQLFYKVALLSSNIYFIQPSSPKGFLARQ